MTSYVPPKKNSGFIFYVALRSQANTKIMQANPTIAAGDFKVSTDGGSLANLGTLPTVTPASGKMVKITLSASEMNGDNVTVVCSDAAGAEWCDLVVNIQTSARQVDDLAYPTTSGRSLDVDASGGVEVGSFQTGAITSGAYATAAITAAAIAADAIGASELAADAATEIAAAVWDKTRSAHATAGTFGESFQGVVNGQAATGTLTTTAFTTNLTEATDDHYNGRIVVWLTGALAGQATDITDYTGSTKLVTVTAMTEAPSNGDRFVIV